MLYTDIELRHDFDRGDRTYKRSSDVSWRHIVKS